TLAEKLGSLAAQLAPGAPEEVSVYATGEVAERELKSLSTAVLRGLLDQLIDLDVTYSVNYVNAPTIARDRGIRVLASLAPTSSDYANAITVEVKRPSGTTRVQGAVFGADTVRLTRIDGFRMEAVPEGYILMLHNRDVPGVVGRVGTLLGENSINIAGLELARAERGGMALSLFHVDDPVPDPVLATLRTQPQAVAPTLLTL